MLLVYPPLEFPSHPHLAVPLIAERLRRQGVGEVNVLDGNLELWKTLLSEGHYRETFDLLERRLAELGGRGDLDAWEVRECEAVVEGAERFRECAAFFRSADPGRFAARYGAYCVR